jgi:hypothetical protein
MNDQNKKPEEKQTLSRQKAVGLARLLTLAELEVIRKESKCFLESSMKVLDKVSFDMALFLSGIEPINLDNLLENAETILFSEKEVMDILEEETKRTLYGKILIIRGVKLFVDEMKKVNKTVVDMAERKTFKPYELEAEHYRETHKKG